MRSRIARDLLVTSFATVTAACSSAASPADLMIAPARVRVDHHVHLNSPAIQGFIPEYCRSVARFGACDGALTIPRSTADLLREMDVAGVRRAVLVSNGYLAVSSMITPLREDGSTLLRAANEWTVAQALAHPDRLVAFVAIDPTRHDAVAEIAHWKGRPGVTGIKLHLTASGSDFRKDEDVAALAAVFRAAGEADLAILIHMRTRRMDYGAEDMRRFLVEVLPYAGDAPVQIAHVGGWGEIDDATLAALGAFVDASEASEDGLDGVWFDLSGVVTASTSLDTRAALAQLVHRIGPRHFLAGSDWPSGSAMAEVFGPVYPMLPITQEEGAAIHSNVAPYADNQ